MSGRGAGLWCPVLAVALLAGAASAQLQAQPVVQPVPAAKSAGLNAALARLARNPRDLSALIDAGNAALDMGDIDAAVGFFDRADQLSPNNMRVKAGLAGALVRSDNPYDAIPLFVEAEKAGVLDPMLLSDRGLAYDLVGDNATAQRYYQQSLAGQPSDETTRRLALSQAIAGDRAAMEATLAPLIQRLDTGALRTKAFALAILDRPEEGVVIANQTMPADLAGGIAPYLRYMHRLTPAQQAAAANFGRFPRAAEIGRDDPRIALYAPPKRLTGADAGLVPAGEPLGKSKPKRDSRSAPQVAVAPPAPPPPLRSAPPEPVPGRQFTPAPQLATASPPERARPLAPAAPTSPVAPVRPPAPPAFAAVPRPAPVPAAAPVTANPAPGSAQAATSGFDLARIGAASAARPAVAASPPPVAAPPPRPAPAIQASAAPVPPRPAPATSPAPAPVVAAALARSTTPAPPPANRRPQRVADAFADFSVVPVTTAPAPGAVDVRKIKAKPVEPPKPAHPSRIWVQVGTGRDPRALAFTWRGLMKENPELFRGKSASISDWGRTNRLLTGPFATEAAAEAFLARLKKNDLDAFLWTSPAGQIVDELDD